MSILCCIPTLNGLKDLARLLDSLAIQTKKFDLCIIDSGSTDGTADLAKSKATYFVCISPDQFNHGGTRQMMVESHPNYDVYVFLTQDTILHDSFSLERLTSFFEDSEVGAVCGRQLPHFDATSIAAHARYFNYPTGNLVKSIDDVSRLGIKTPFMSNSFSGYRATALMESGGFPSYLICSEDMYISAKMLQGGWKIAYAGDALCRHSHNYSVIEEFRRYFDIGVFHSREPWIMEFFGGAKGEGYKFVLSELAFLGLKKVYLWPFSLMRNIMKLLAYQLGQKEKFLPLSFKRKLGSCTTYWSS